MAITFQREATIGGDSGVWGTPEQAQNHLNIGINTAYLYNDAGALKLSVGKVGLDDGSIRGVITITAVETISLVGLTASCWAKIELARSGTTGVLTIASIVGATNAESLPAGFTGAFDPAKGSFHISSNKRCIGLAWINAGGTLEGIVNTLPNVNGYIGYSQSDDANDIPFYFHKVIDNIYINKWIEIYQVTGDKTIAKLNADLTIFILSSVGPAGNITITLPPIANSLGKKVLFINENATHTLIIEGNGAETLEGFLNYEIWPNLKYQLEFICSVAEWKRTSVQWVNIKIPATGLILNKTTAWGSTDSFSGSNVVVDFSTYVPKGARGAGGSCGFANANGQIYWRPNGDSSINNAPNANSFFSHRLGSYNGEAAAPQQQYRVILEALKIQLTSTGNTTQVAMSYPFEFQI